MHRESVKGLVKMEEAPLFVSGSLDGVLVVWLQENLLPLKILNNPDPYRDDNSYLYPIWHLTPLSDRYLAATMGKGFRIYDLDTDECLVNCDRAHDAVVAQVIQIFNGKLLLSCSTDSLIRVWDTSDIKNLTTAKLSYMASCKTGREVSRLHYNRRLERERNASIVGANTVSETTTRGNPEKDVRRKIGELRGHSSDVHGVLAFPPYSFISCGADGLVLLWKDGDGGRKLEDHEVYQVLMERQKTRAELAVKSH
eukprot:TRINITY_DN788_c0_g1_i1.p1 TRINITY_DN788_c0_g1~~TRINITY_DN788_c0_g1_i1.p1  ORF type:complete len:254 (-),score=20.17 TRINITY_DN788_c0_g1_i1:63-824(-)